MARKVKDPKPSTLKQKKSNKGNKDKQSWLSFVQLPSLRGVMETLKLKINKNDDTLEVIDMDAIPLPQDISDKTFELSSSQEDIDLAKELQPKVVVAENVKGLLLGEAKQYVRKIYKEFKESGYELRIQPYLLDASKMGVPQGRERVFFMMISP